MLLRYMWQKNKTLMKIAIILIAFVLIFGTLCIADAVQQYYRSKNVVGVELQESSDTIHAYDVEGMTDEEIAEYLELIRSQSGNGE